MSDSVDKGKWTELLKAVEFFKPFDSADLDEMFELSVVKKYPPRSTIIMESAIGDSFYVILSGRASVVKEEKINEYQIISKLATGDCFGEMAILLDEPRSATILAETDCIVFEIEKDEIDQLRIEVREKLYRQFAIMISRRLKYNPLGK